MDAENRLPTPPSGESMETVNWRTQLSPDSRQKIVNKIASSLNQLVSVQLFSGPEEDLEEFQKVAIRFEEKIFMTASSLHDYATKIRSKLLMIESESPNKSKAPDPGFQDMKMKDEVYSQGEPIPSLQQNNQSQAHQQWLPQNVPNNMASAGVHQTCAGLQSAQLLASGSTSTHNPIANVVGLNSNIQNMSGNSPGQRMAFHCNDNQQKQMQGHTNRPRKLASTLQQGQLPQINQIHSHNNQKNPRLQLLNFQGSVPTMVNNMTSFQHNSLSSLPGVSTAWQLMPNSLQPGSNVESGQGNALRSNSSMFQRQHLKQHQGQLMPTQLQMHQMPQVHQINDVNIDMIRRQGVGVNQGSFEQHLPAGHHQSYNTHQQLRIGSRSPFSSPQLLQATSPQMLQHSSPWVDRQSQRISISKSGTPLHSANSPIVISSPSTPSAPSPIPNVGPDQGIGVRSVSQSLASGIPQISASPLLVESTGIDANQANSLDTVSSSNSNITEQPLERLIKAVKSMPPSALVAAVIDIGAVVSMTDGMAASAHGGRAAIDQDLVAMTKCRLRARNFLRDGMNGTKKMRRDITAMPLN